MKQLNKLVLFSIPFLLLFLIACSENPDEAGINIIPAGDKFGLRNTEMPVLSAKTVKGDALNANNNRFVFLGYNKSAYGTVKADFCAKFSYTYSTSRYSSIADEMRYFVETDKNSLIIKDLYLQLYMVGVTDKDDWLRINVYRLSKHMPDTLSLKTNFDIHPYCSYQLLGSDIVRPADTLVRINLDYALAEEIRNLDTNALKNPDTLTYRVFNGLFVTIDTNSMCNKILTIPIERPENGIFINYSTASVDTSIQLIFKYNYKKPVGYRDYYDAFNHFEHQTFGSQNKNEQFIQTFGSSYSQISLKDQIAVLKDSMPLVINHAEILVYRDLSAINANNSNLLSKLEVKYRDKEGVLKSIKDLAFSSSGYFNRNVDGNNWFQLNITRHLQDCINEDSIFDIYITPADTANRLYFQRLMLKNDSLTPFKLKILYHKL